MTYGLVLDNIQKHYNMGSNRLPVLNNVNLSIAPGETIALLGASGVGKSTLLHLAGLLDKPSSGHIYIDGEKCNNPVFYSRIRNKKIGFIYQIYNLLTELNVIDNIALPLLIGGESLSASRSKASALLDKLHLTHLKNRAISVLSGGEKQRLAICRALINSPKLILADEPTGSLDSKTAFKVFNFLLNYTKAYSASLLIATHNYELAQGADKIFTLKDTKLFEVTQP